MWDKIIGVFKSNVVEQVGNVVDNLATSDDEKSAAKERLTSVVMSSLTEALKAQESVLKTEMQGNWLQRSWRPLTMLTFVVMIVIGAFKEIPYMEGTHPFWQLLELGLGGYVVGRSVEKIAGNVTKNIDMPFLKKKNR